MADEPKVGRPSIYSPELASRVCERISDGASLLKVCRDESMPCKTTVLKWAREIPEFATQYAQAREMLLEHWAEEIVDISDDTSHDTLQKTDEDGKIYAEVANTEWITRSRLRVDTRKWLLSKLAAKKYGDRISAELSGPDGGPIETAEVGENEVARRIAYLLSSAMPKPASG